MLLGVHGVVLLLHRMPEEALEGGPQAQVHKAEKPSGDGRGDGSGDGNGDAAPRHGGRRGAR